MEHQRKVKKVASSEHPKGFNLFKLLKRKKISTIKYKETKMAKKSTYFHRMKIPGSQRLFYSMRAKLSKPKH